MLFKKFWTRYNKDRYNKSRMQARRFVKRFSPCLVSFCILESHDFTHDINRFELLDFTVDLLAFFKPKFVSEAR